MHFIPNRTTRTADGLPIIYFDEFTGIAVRLPQYSAPVLQYLQPLPKEGKAVEVREPEPLDTEADEIVLMPDVTFTLVDRKTGVDYGSTSLSLQEYHEASKVKVRNWFTKVSEKRLALEKDPPKPGRLVEQPRTGVPYNPLLFYNPGAMNKPAPISTLRDCTVRRNSYNLSLDVFAPRSGR